MTKTNARFATWLQPGWRQSRAGDTVTVLS